jgi:DNA-binding beta-propeller fold protein YncE
VISGPNGGGTLTVYALSSGSFGNPVAQIPLTLPGYPSDSIVSTGINVLANGSAVYVTAYDLSAYNPGCTPISTCITSTANPGWVFGFTVGSSGGLTPVAGSPWKAGIKPTAIASDPTNRFVYVTDFAQDQLIGFTVQSTDVLDFMVNGPFKTGDEPSAVAIDPRGLYIYVANSLDSTVSAYVISLATGTPSAALNTTGSANNPTDTEPVAILVDAALGRFVYTANHLGNSVSGFRLNATTGTLTSTLTTPYATGDTPTALASVPHGNHSVQSTAP